MNPPKRPNTASTPREQDNELPQTPCRIDDPRVIEQVQQYRAALLEGRQPLRETLLDKFPQISTELSACLDALELVRGAMPPLNGQNGLPDSDARTHPPIGKLGDFQLLREIGRGGMGIVYEAEQISLGGAWP